jgi:adenine-specific DNA-methyltransferase
MARIHDLIRQVAAQSPDLATDIEREVAVLSERLAFGLNFERHTPEEVELPGRPVRRGDKVHVLPSRGEMPKAENSVMWVVESVDRGSGSATIARVDAKGAAETQDVGLDDLVVVAEFRDPIYPGLVSTGTVERGGDKPYHSVINGENFHALQTLLFTHRGKVDAIYIDPPYNTGARDWKYNNDYVESEDLYRHSKWLAFMERRLLLAKELLNPEDSVLIVTIDEKEYPRLALLLEQTFPQAEMQVVTSVINPKGSARAGRFSRVDEYLYFLFFGAASVRPWSQDMLRSSEPGSGRKVRWAGLMRNGEGSRRTRIPSMFFPIYLAAETGAFHSVGQPPPVSTRPEEVPAPDGTVAVWPIDGSGQELMWRLNPDSVMEYIEEGWLRFGKWDSEKRTRSISYLQQGILDQLAAGEIVVTGRTNEGALEIEFADAVGTKSPVTVWNMTSHSASDHGAAVLKALIPGRRFPYPKSVYAVEDSLRFVVGLKPTATIVDFFAGSGTTAQAVMRLNKQDVGRRVSILVTNNEVSADEHAGLRKDGLRPGDAEWERWGICEHITKPRIQAAISGTKPDGEPVEGEYKFTDIFPMSDGFEENVEFFNVTYEAPLRVTSNRDFPKIAPLLWLRAGSTGRRIDSIDAGWDVADTYGVLADLDKSEAFITAVADAAGVRVVFVITDEDRLFESVVRDLPEHVEPVRMYDAYLRNFELESRVPR